MFHLPKNTLPTLFVLAFLVVLSNVTVNTAQFVAAFVILTTFSLMAYVGYRGLFSISCGSDSEHSVAL